jgi:dTDP-4-amino-4,6-dideoxygalactose transaminase
MTDSPRHTPLADPLWVTQPLLPPLEEYVDQLRDIWGSGTITNLGAKHVELESLLAQRVGSRNLTLWNNGTAALVGMLSQFDLSGEVIVTPFTFPATVHAISAIGLTPVFADIDDVDLTLSPESVRSAITSRTTAILGTHIYGTSCDTEALSAVAREHGLTLLFDGAHSFGVRRPVFGDSPTALGDATMLSFHATKLFHTVEGGAVVTPHDDVHARLKAARNFGITGEDEVFGVGLNGKMSELHAAMGLLMLDRIDHEVDLRAVVAERYSERLRDRAGLTVVAGLAESKQYFVVRFDRDLFGESRDDVHARLRSYNINTRRYFYPLCADIDVYASLPSSRDLPAARSAADEVLALPFYGGLDLTLVDMVCDLILAGPERR